MTSTRLPGKVLRPILGRPMLLLQLERVLRIKGVDKIIVATPETQSDEIADQVKMIPQIGIFKGSEEDVLERYYKAATTYEADIVIRITSDCPVIDPEIVSSVLNQFLGESPRYDYASTVNYPRGIAIEVFSYQALEAAAQEAKKPYEREHVTPFIWQNEKRFSLLKVAAEKDYSHLRLTVDTIEDFNLITQIYERLYPQNKDFGFKDILNLFEIHPELIDINRHIKQKTLPGS